MTMLRIVLGILAGFTAIGLCCAARLSMPSDSAGLALRPDADGGRLVIPSGLVSISHFFTRRRHA